MCSIDKISTCKETWWFKRKLKNWRTSENRKKQTSVRPVEEKCGGAREGRLHKHNKNTG